MTYRDCIAQGLRECGCSEPEIQRRLDKADTLAAPAIGSTRTQLSPEAASDVIAAVKRDFGTFKTPAGQSFVNKEIARLAAKLLPKN